ncbi:MAG: heme-binding protein [Ilumatobacteraceae bacterium]
MTHHPTITAERAQRIIDAAIGHGARHGMKPLVVLVLDAGGIPVAYLRSDGSPTGRFAIANGKANGALALGVNSRRIGEMAIERPHFINGVMASIDGPMVPVAGGVLVLDGGVVVGAVGVSGDTSDNDEAAAMAGIAAAGYTHP